MSYQSLEFLLFCAAALVLYYAVGKKGQKWVLAVANIAFFAISGLEYLPFIAVTLCTTFFCGMKIGKIYDKADEQLAACQTPAEKKEVRTASKKSAKKVLIAGLIVAVGLLAVCKYSKFTVTNINLILEKIGISQIPTFNMILPIGISFYTFMSISYVLDIYWKRYKWERNFLMYTVYLTYFPHVVQGPIDRYKEFKDQIAEGISLKYENITQGAQLALWGFFKKLVVADRLGLFVDEIIGNYKEQDGAFIALAFLVYSIQIYGDFSGCIDIVTGISEMFGIKLRKNFNHPYFSKTMGEFWRRWHISLQEWFKDYIYFPVSTSQFIKNTKKKLRGKKPLRAETLFASCFPILVVWLVTGIWHGADWKFLAWGLFHAALLIGSEVCDPLFKKLTAFFKLDTEKAGWGFLQMVRTFILCTIGRIFSRAGGIGSAFAMIKSIITDTHINKLIWFDYTTLDISYKDYNVMFISVLVLLVVDILQEKMHLRQTLAKQNIVFRWILIFGLLFAVIIFGIYGPGYDASSFIYEQF